MSTAWEIMNNVSYEVVQCSSFLNNKKTEFTCFAIFATISKICFILKINFIPCI